MTPEGKVKAAARRIFKDLGVWYYPAIGGHGARAGAPDDLCCYKGFFFGIEYKAGRNRPTPLQELEMNRIKEASGICLVVNEKNLDTLEEEVKACARVRILQVKRGEWPYD